MVWVVTMKVGSLEKVNFTHSLVAEEGIKVI